MFTIGQKIILKNNPSRSGELTSQIKRGATTYWKIKFENGRVEIIPESQIEVLNNIEAYSLDDLVRYNKFSSPQDIRRVITHTRINGNLSNIVYSMDVTNTDFYAYQFKPVCKIINSPSNSILIADEVGLGKTIEAGLIWTELKQRYDAKKLVVICPGVLREKWKTELRNKMGLKAEIVKADELLKRIEAEDEYAFICSIQGIGNDKSKKILSELVDKGNKIIDMLIIDEAHYLRNEQTKAHKVAKYLRSISDYAVFLSATPIQNKSTDLFSLVHILDPYNFPYENSFNSLLSTNKALVNARDNLLSTTHTKEDIIKIIDSIYSNDWSGIFKKSKQLKALKEKVKSFQENDLTLNVVHRIAYELDEVNALGHIYTRTRKKDVHEFKAVREAIPETIPMSDYEHEVYQLISDKIMEYAQEIGASTGFLLCTPQRLLTSSFYASIHAWKNKYKIHFEDFDENDENNLDYLSEFLYEICEIANKIDTKKLYQEDTKYKRLREIILKLRKEYPNDKIVLFSTFVNTLEYLNKRLDDDGISSCLLTGKTKDKDQILKEFKENENLKILLASEVGSEGVDLQFCRMLINYDLPWNPMRVEQRIGRIDRIGQKYDKILIWNIFHDSTIDARIYNKLYKKFSICTSALGDFEVILGDMFKELSIELLQLSEDEQLKKLEQIAGAIENKQIENDKLEQSASQLTAYGDYILDQIQNEKSNRITPNDLAIYVIETLKSIYPDLRVSQVNFEGNKDDIKYELNFPVQFKYEFEDFCDTHNHSKRTKLLSNYSNIICSFKNKINSFSKNIEIIGQTHPLIRFLKEKQANSITKNYPASAIVVSGEEKGEYLILATLISALGITNYAKIIYSGIDINNEYLLEPDAAENLFLKALNTGRNWVERQNLNYEDLSEKTLYIITENQLIYEKEIDYIKNKNFDRAEIQKNTLYQHLEQRKNVFDNVIQNLKFSGNEKLIKLQEGKFNKLKESIDERLYKIEKSKNITHEKQDICLILLKVM